MELLLCVHNDGAIPGYGLFKRLAGNEEETNSIVAGVYDRYQSRVAWIMPLCLACYVCCLVKERKPTPV